MKPPTYCMLCILEGKWRENNLFESKTAQKSFLWRHAIHFKLRKYPQNSGMPKIGGRASAKRKHFSRMPFVFAHFYATGAGKYGKFSCFWTLFHQQLAVGLHHGLPCNCIILRLRLVIIYTVVQNKRLDYCRQNALAQLKSCLYENRIRKSSRIDEWLYRSHKVVRNGAIQYVMMCDFLFLGPDVQNILRQSYDYLTIMPKLRSNGRLIYKTSYNEWKAFDR